MSSYLTTKGNNVYSWCVSHPEKYAFPSKRTCVLWWPFQIAVAFLQCFEQAGLMCSLRCEIRGLASGMPSNMFPIFRGAQRNCAHFLGWHVSFAFLNPLVTLWMLRVFSLSTHLHNIDPTFFLLFIIFSPLRSYLLLLFLIFFLYFIRNSSPSFTFLCSSFVLLFIHHRFTSFSLTIFSFYSFSHHLFLLFLFSQLPLCFFLWDLL